MFLNKHYALDHTNYNEFSLAKCTGYKIQLRRKPPPSQSTTFLYFLVLSAEEIRLCFDILHPALEIKSVFGTNIEEFTQ